MGLFLAIALFVATLGLSVLLFVGEAMADIRGDQVPWMSITTFLSGTAVSALLAFTHYHPIGW